MQDDAQATAPASPTEWHDRGVDAAAAGGQGLHHGDVVVFDGAGSLAPYRSAGSLERGLEDVARWWGVGAAEDVAQVEVAEELERVALAALQKAYPDRVLATNVEYYSAIVLDVAEIPPPLAPAMFACSRVAGWSAHILEQKRAGRLIRPSARYVGHGPRPIEDVKGFRAH